MDRLVANYGRMAALADELNRLVSRLELGDSHYLRNAMRPEVTGSRDVTDACAEFENEWAFGRDRLTLSLEKLIGFLNSAALEYAEADAGMANKAGELPSGLNHRASPGRGPSSLGGPRNPDGIGVTRISADVDTNQFEPGSVS